MIDFWVGFVVGGGFVVCLVLAALVYIVVCKK